MAMMGRNFLRNNSLCYEAVFRKKLHVIQKTKRELHSDYAEFVMSIQDLKDLVIATCTWLRYRSTLSSQSNV
jgi:hypothetical protein